MIRKLFSNKNKSENLFTAIGACEYLLKTIDEIHVCFILLNGFAHVVLTIIGNLIINK